ncbi:MAG TPA: hypothetical protein PKD90_20325, partial [Phnomibacter sp.]|nr:hypothetical protein [Phnomibacter sp.]
ACNVQPCHNSFAASYQAVYDTATNRVQFNWTDAANLPTRIRWRNLAGTALDSVVLTNHGGSYTLQLPCGGMRYR